MLFCRLLQLFNPEPIQNNPALFIVKARIEFNKLIQNVLKERKVVKSMRPNS